MQIALPRSAALADEPDWFPHEALPRMRRFVDVDGACLHVLEHGEGRPVVLVHGSPMWSYTWRHTLRSLDARCLAVDLPGFGRSTAPLVDRPFERNAEALAGLLRALDLRDVCLVAHATAGPSAIAAAAAERPRVRSLVLVNTFAWDLFDSPLAPIARVVSSAPFCAINRLTNLLPRITSIGGRRVGRFDAEEKRALLGPFRSARTRAHLSAVLGGIRRERDWLAALETGALESLSRTPALLLFGAHDNGGKAGHAERLARTLTLSESVRLARSGHFPTEDEPEEVTARLARWLDVR